MSFVGEHERTIDAKNRLSIPVEYRTVEAAGEDIRVFYLVPGPRGGMLSLYAEKDFARCEEEVPSDLMSDEDELTFLQMFYSQATRLEVDKQGRVLLPERILKRYQISREVYVTGAKDRLDIWSKKAYEAFWEQNAGRYDEIKRLARQARDRRTIARVNRE